LVLWEEAIRATQFAGVSRESAAFREWKEKEGDGLSSPLAKNALLLYFRWLHLTIQRDAGTPVKELLPQIFAYSRDLLADEQLVIENEEAIRKEKELATLANPGNPAAKKGPPAPVHKASHDQSRRAHDAILKRGLSGSPIVQWLRLADFINPGEWESNPGNFDGIYLKIIQAAYREAKDPKALEYWDLKIRREGDAAARTRLAFDADKFTSLQRPILLWNRAEELHLIGMRNRGILEMLNLIRNHPLHPQAAAWIKRLELILAPPTEGAEAAPTPTPTPDAPNPTPIPAK
jgi:hypothetical protein